VFTSGGSESNNHAVEGIFFASRNRGGHIITTAVEHPAAIDPCRFLERLGAKVTLLPVDRQGMVDPDDVRKAITPRAILITVMHANNEVGTVEPIPRIAAIAREAGIPFHTDAAQSVGKIETDVERLGVDLLSVAGHKVYAPKGIGALCIREGRRIEPFVHGAGHEGGRRAGTENVLLAVALGSACHAARSRVGMAQVRTLRDLFWAASAGSACHAGSVTLVARYGRDGRSGRRGDMGAVRFSLGRTTSSGRAGRGPCTPARSRSSRRTKGLPPAWHVADIHGTCLM